jgi:acyl-[acyl-carrier-protein]-phospholipid O-acyltransferase/long-chain-fatty-acid--[acyl-carrier-protein] ligase
MKKFMSTDKLPKGFKAFLVTESLGAFNDNFFKMLLQLYILNVAKFPNAEALIAKLAIAFTIPFVLFGPWSGALADKFAKSQIIKMIKGTEIIIVSIGLYVLTLGHAEPLIGALFLLATHSAFFAPAKAGYIPETCAPALISKANGLVGMTTFLSIILGTALAGVLMTVHKNNPISVGFYSIAFAIIGTVSAFFIPRTAAKRPGLKMPRNPVRGIIEDLKTLKANRAIFLASLAHSYFWLLGLVLQTNILVYGKFHLSLRETDSMALSGLPAILGVGIALGSLLASRWSGRKVEIGLVPLGGFGLSVAAIALFFTPGHYSATLSVLFFAGIFGGLFIIPLFAFIQFEAPADSKGQTLATLGIMNGLFLVLGSLLYDLLAVQLQLTPAQISLVMGILSAGVTMYICTVIPQYFVRFLSWLLTHTVYDIRIQGQENVPAEGPVLLVPNHVSFIDALLVGACLQRFIRFIMWKKIYDLPGVKQMCKLMDVIPVAPYEGRESIIKSLDAAKAKLIQGEAVCIFAEGGITRDGDLHEFKPGMETIMHGLNGPIIPVYLHNVWGSLFSFSEGKVLWKWPKRIPYRVTVIFGAPMVASSSAKEVEAAVRKLANLTKRPSS